MSQRSPMNKRNQPERERTSGMARRSASSAKPARAAASSVRVVPAKSKARRAQRERGESLAGLSKEEKRARRAEERRFEDRVYSATEFLLKEQPVYKQRRRTWWTMLGIAGVLALVSLILFFVLNISETHPELVTGGFVVLVCAYALLFVAVGYDFIRIRPVRNEVRATVEGMSENKLDAVLERAARERAERDEKARTKKKKKSA